MSHVARPAFAARLRETLFGPLGKPQSIVVFQCSAEHHAVARFPSDVQSVRLGLVSMLRRASKHYKMIPTDYAAGAAFQCPIEQDVHAILLEGRQYGWRVVSMPRRQQVDARKKFYQVVCDLIEFQCPEGQLAYAIRSRTCATRSTRRFNARRATGICNPHGSPHVF